MSTAIQRMAEFTAGLDLASVPAAVVARAQDCLLHGLVVGIAGRDIGFGETAEAAVYDGGAGGSAHLLTTGGRAGAVPAAFANSALLHARAQEDTHGTFHPGIVTIPAALAAAENAEADGATFLAGMIAGYEVATAVSDPLTELTTPPFRATGLYGPLAAAAAAARVFGLDRPKTTSALALAAAFAGGTSETFAAGTDEWHYQGGVAAANGLMAALLARQGARGSVHALEGRAGFIDSFARGAEKPGCLADRLGAEWRILDVTFKPFPVCAFNQIPALGAAKLACEEGIRAQDVVTLDLKVNEREGTYPGVGYDGPFTEVAQTLMSVSFGVATALVHGQVDYAALQRFADPDVLSLMRRITVIPDPAQPPKSVAATATLVDGRQVRIVIDDAAKELSWSRDGVRENAQRLLPEMDLTAEQLNRLFAAVDALPNAADLSVLLAAVLPSCRPVKIHADESIPAP
ncbi:MmgE/PrpD family protein [Saccharopolyspora phatthalungensis]|uniref:2-methylcitrate dehydratase PrpD n=1 Tax=Saccharopolyspora phatthalungensis TaxID=664693 RepID=A0A840QBU0_9PSEU|nr:MmgE/PrpD family protein [Saccharopolyspora phatthalungensis]MBB5157260.1 2-methylcitrate dehydratase PrpD [Saccharopolyspora phatthalungensis]